MATAIQTEGLGKRFALGVGSGRENLREALSRLARRDGSEPESVWALRDVSVAVAEGETVGVVGRNGAGKTTLLRLLARITEPTAGRARIRGRVGALLEVGTGFHPELTGEENIYLGGAVLGMRRRDVRRRYDEIVAFSGIEGFLGTPVKRYSSGMYLRLAFSVAAHLEPDILLVDEVLAVGDAEFQQRCLGKMSELGREGRTVVFVSHDAGAVTDLCSRAIWLDDGRVVREGRSDAVVAAYMSQVVGEATRTMPIPRHSGAVRLERAEVAAADGNASPRRGEPVCVRLYLAGEPPPGFDVAVYVLDDQGRRLIDDALSDHPEQQVNEDGAGRVDIVLPPVLRAGDYALGVWLGTAHEEYLDAVVGGFTIAPRFDDRAEPLRRQRLLQPDVSWEIDVR